MDGIGSTMFSAVKAHNAMLCKEVSSMSTHLGGRLGDLASQRSGTTSPSLLVPAEARLRGNQMPSVVYIIT